MKIGLKLSAFALSCSWHCNERLIEMEKLLFIVISTIYLVHGALCLCKWPPTRPSTSETISPSSSVLATLRLVASQYASLQTTAAFCSRRRVAIMGWGDRRRSAPSVNQLVSMSADNQLNQSPVLVQEDRRPEEFRLYSFIHSWTWCRTWNKRRIRSPDWVWAPGWTCCIRPWVTQVKPNSFTHCKTQV